LVFSSLFSLMMMLVLFVTTLRFSKDEGEDILDHTTRSPSSSELRRRKARSGRESESSSSPSPRFKCLRRASLSLGF
jgi:hypothetical protein